MKKEKDKFRNKKKFEKTIEVIVKEDGKRLDVFLSSLTGVRSRSYAEKLVSDGYVLINGKEKDKSYRVRLGDKVTVNIPLPQIFELVPYEIDLDIRYEDDDVVVLSKPSGLVTHSSPGHWDDTLVNALIAKVNHLSTLGGPTRPGIVHRLDKDTSGLMVIAKSDDAHLFLSRKIKERKVKRTYITLVCGNIYRSEFIVQAPIGKHRTQFQKMTVDFNRGKSAVTTFEVVKNYQGYTLLKAALGTGRTHQIRVHLSTLGHPVAGDPIYGGIRCARRLPLSRLFLHAVLLEFEHPTTGKVVRLEDELPLELQTVVEHLKKYYSI